MVPAHYQGHHRDEHPPKSCAGHGKGGKAEDINPLDVVGFTPELCFPAR